MNRKGLFNWFRKAALAEGVSFLVLLLIAMPLKYVAGYPLAVTIAGGIHGLLFIVFMILLYLVKVEFRKDKNWVVNAIIASILPFGTIIMDKEWKKEVPAKTGVE